MWQIEKTDALNKVTHCFRRCFNAKRNVSISRGV